MFALGGFTELEGRIMNSMHLHTTFRIEWQFQLEIVRWPSAVVCLISSCIILKKTIDLLQPLEMFGPDILFL